MHELAICRALVRQLESVAAEHPGNKIIAVHLMVGSLSGVVPDLLCEAFPFVSTGTAAEDARLDIDKGEIRVHCPECGEDSSVSSNKMNCRQCGNWRTELISGHELMLLQVELERDDLRAATVH